jgi:glycosyltransferase involved in cell wall biosynthesis
MKAILTNQELKQELETKALERSFDFSWRKTAIETLNAFEEVLTR